MARRFVVLLGGMMCLGMVVQGWANEPQFVKGTVVSASTNRLVMKDSGGKEQSFTIDHATKVTVNGQPGKLEDLQETMPVQVATDEKGKVLTVSTIDKEKLPAFATATGRDPLKARA